MRNRNYKKWIAAVLTTAMLLTMNTPSFAAEAGDTQASGDSINVEITWGEMKFEYDARNEGTDNPTWSCAENGNKITVSSTSNVALKASLDFQPTAKEKGNAIQEAIEAEFQDESKSPIIDLSLTAGNAEPQTSEAFLRVKTGKITGDVQLGVITVTIEKDELVSMFSDTKEDVKNLTDGQGIIIDETESTTESQTPTSENTTNTPDVLTDGIMENETTGSTEEKSSEKSSEEPEETVLAETGETLEADGTEVLSGE